MYCKLVLKKGGCSQVEKEGEGYRAAKKIESGGESVQMGGNKKENPEANYVFKYSTPDNRRPIDLK